MIGGFIQSGFPLGYVLGSLVFALVSYPDHQRNHDRYGWRIVFMTGVIPVFLALYIRNNLHESPEFEKAKARARSRKSPFLSLFKPPQLWDFLQVFFFMTGLFLTDYSVYGFLPNILTLKGRGFDTTTYSLIYGFALFMAFLGYNFYGWLSDRTGRKILTQWYCAFWCVFGIPVFYVLYHAAIARNLWMAVLGTSWQPCSSWPGESFPPISASASPPAPRRRCGFRLLLGSAAGRLVQRLRMVGSQDSVHRRDREAGSVAVASRDPDRRRDHDLRQPAVLSGDQGSSTGRSREKERAFEAGH
jgi:MFS family permease